MYSATKGAATARPPLNTKTGTLCWLYLSRPQKPPVWITATWIARRGGPKGAIFEGWSVQILPGTFNPEVLAERGWRYHSVAVPPLT